MITSRRRFANASPKPITRDSAPRKLLYFPDQIPAAFPAISTSASAKSQRVTVVSMQSSIDRNKVHFPAQIQLPPLDYCYIQNNTTASNHLCTDANFYQYAPMANAPLALTEINLAPKASSQNFMASPLRAGLHPLQNVHPTFVIPPYVSLLYNLAKRIQPSGHAYLVSSLGGHCGSLKRAWEIGSKLRCAKKKTKLLCMPRVAESFRAR